MRKLLGKLIAVLALVAGAGAVQSYPMTVTINDRVWLQPIDFINLSWDTISSACDSTTGACSGFLNAIDVSGYKWANVNDINGLFNSVITTQVNPLGPGPDAMGEFSPSALSLYAAGFAFITDYSTDTEVLGRVDAWTRDITGCGGLSPPPPGTSCAIYAVYFIFYPEDRPLLSIYDTRPFIYTEYADSFIGGWFYRAVPTPATLALFGFGLAGLGWSRRKKA